MHRYLVLYYDDNANRLAIVKSVDRTTVPHYIADVAQANGWDVTLVLELHHDYIDGDLYGVPPELVMEGVPYNIEALPEFGAE